MEGMEGKKYCKHCGENHRQGLRDLSKMREAGRGTELGAAASHRKQHKHEHKRKYKCQWSIRSPQKQMDCIFPVSVPWRIWRTQVL